MKSFYVINENFNSKTFEPYDIMPYLINVYNEKSKKNRPVTFEQCKKFIEQQSLYQWWGRCQYEIIISSWPPTKDGKEAKKVDVHQQVMMNIDIITEIFMQNLNL